jgi:hypothetical protein
MMKKKILLFGSLLAVFLMLMIPNVSAIQYITLEHETTQLVRNMSEDEIKNAILRRMQHLKKSFTFNINMTDPDGPLKGGLDDLTDYINLILGLGGSFSLLHSIIELIFSQNLYDKIRLMISSGILSIGTLEWLGEAFDIIEMPTEDGR